MESSPDVTPDAALPAKLRKMVRELALPGGRMVGSPGHAQAAAWVEANLKSLRLDPYRGDAFSLPYHCNGEAFTNFAGVLAGRDRSLAPILIGAHYDSVIPHPWADDNAAAVAVALRAIAQLSTVVLERDVVIAIFDAEEPPYFQAEAMGSVRFCEDQSDDRGFHAAIILDLVGHDVTLPQLGLLTPPPIRRLLAVQGAESNPALADLVGALTPEKISLIALKNDYLPDMSDHYAFRREGVPYLFFTCAPWEHYHQPTDTPEKLNYRKMARISALVSEAARQLATMEIKPEAPACDFTASIEARTIRRALGPWLRFLNIHRMDTRDDVDAFAAVLLASLRW